MDCNAATEALLGYEQDAFGDATLSDLVAPRADRSAEEVRDVFADVDEDSEAFEWLIQRSNGEPRWVRVTVREVGTDGDEHVRAEFRDLTRYKAQERRLQLLYRVLRHNLRNEMNVIHGRAEQLEAAIESDDIQRQIEVIKDTAKDVGELSETVTEFQRLIDGDDLDRRPVDVAELLRDTAETFVAEYPSASVETDIDRAARVSADDGLGVALDQAVRNAIEHHDGDEPQVTLGLSTTDEEVVVEIADKGPGIPEIELEILDGTATMVEHGDGLGLPVIRWCVRSLGGELAIETDPDRGSVVSIYLPKLHEPA